MTAPTLSFPTSAVAPTADPSIDALLGMYPVTKWGGPAGTGVSLTYSFPWTTSSTATFAGYNGGAYSPLGEPNGSTVYGLNAVQQVAATKALNAWAAVAKVSFQQVADTASDVGDIRFAFTSVSQSSAVGGAAWGWATLPDAYQPAAGDIWISTQVSSSSNSNWAEGSKNYQALLHEAGHALGLKHSFEGWPTLPASTDSEQYTVMSYTQAPHSLFFQISADGRTGQFVTIHPDTPMLLDIAAMQYLYGVNTTYHTGNDVYTFDPATPFMRTIWDAGGNDAISVANFTRGCTIDLRAGHFSSIAIPSASTAGFTFSSPPPVPTYDGTDNLAIAYGVTIERAVGGSGNDVLIGNDAGDTFTGGAGNDTITGGAGIDTALYGGPRSAYAVTFSGGTCKVQDVRGSDGTDSLTSVERLHFADPVSHTDSYLALDLGGNAGMVAKIFGAAFGAASLGNAAAVGIGLRLADSGTAYADLMQAALNAAGATSNKAVVDTLYTNVVGTAPGADAEAYFVGLLDQHTFTPGTLGELAADTAANQDHIGLVGLAATGLAYIPA